MAAGRYDEAAALYAELSRALPGDAGLLMNLGISLTMAGRPGDGIGPLRRAAELQPSLHAAWLFLGSAYLDTGATQPAVEALTRALATDPRSLKARRMLADAYMQLEQYDAAARELEQLAAAEPSDAAVWYALGQSHEAGARMAFEALRHDGKGKAYTQLLAADVLVSEEDFAGAIDLYRDALESLPPMRAVFEELADLYEHVGEAGQAAAVRKTLDSVSKEDCARNVPECEFMAGRYREALVALEARTDPEAQYWRARAHNELAAAAFATLEQLPPSAESHAFRAEQYRSQGRHVDSVTELRAAAKLAPADRRIQRELATSLYLSRDYQAAELLLADLVEQAPGSAELQFLYGDTLLQGQKLEEAIPHLESAVRGAVDFTDARISLARAYLQVGRHADAIPHLKAVLASDEDGSLHYQLARAYQATGQPELAQQMLVKYAEIEKTRRK